MTYNLQLDFWIRSQSCLEPHTHRCRLSVTSSTKCITQERSREGKSLGKTLARLCTLGGARLYDNIPHQVEALWLCVLFSHLKVFPQDADVPLIECFSLWKDVWKHLCSDLRERLMQAGIVVPNKEAFLFLTSSSGIRMLTEPQDSFFLFLNVFCWLAVESVFGLPWVPISWIIKS